MEVLLAKDKRKGSGVTLLKHTLDVINAARIVVANLPEGVFDKATLENDLVLCAAFHDTGKAATGFQEVLLGQRQNWNHKRHEILSTAFAAQCDELSAEARLAILTHHRKLPIADDKGALPDNQLPNEENRLWREMVGEWTANREPFRRFWQGVCEYIDRPDLMSLAEYDLNQIGLASAWLRASKNSPSGQVRTITFERRKLAALYRGLLVTADHMASGNAVPPAFPDLRAATIYNGTLRGFQERCAATANNTILRAPTGSGKTESALLWMQSNWRTNSRVFYVLPYTASINAMHRRLQRIFCVNTVNVLHSKASSYLYNQLAQRDELSSKQRQSLALNLASLSKEMYFPIRVCTPHQILRYALRGKGWEQMLGEFPQACFIFDEIHAYDPVLTGLILGVARMAKEVDARMLFTTATLPRFLQKLIQEHVGIDSENVITPDPANKLDRLVLDKKRHRVEIWDGTLLDRMDEIVQAMATCEHTLIVCNHVRSASRVYRELRKHYGTGVMLLHSRFAHCDRNYLENELTGKGKALPRVLVATQVVEVSLDIDFDQAFFEAAPIDAAAQRMGRVNRAGNRPPARVIIMRQQISPHHLYSADRCARTVAAMERLNGPISEDTLVDIANEVYGDGYSDDQLAEFNRALNHSYLNHPEESLVAGTHEAWAEDLFSEQDDRMEILPDVYVTKYDQCIGDGRWLEAVSYLVPLPASMVIGSKLFRSVERRSDAPWIIYKPYSPEAGLEIDVEDDMED